MDKQVVITSAVRTPIGAFQGVLSPATAPQLGAAAITGAIARGGIGPADVQEVIMGCVLPAGLGQAPARQAAIGAEIPQGVPTTTINKMCGSGMKAIMMAADQIRTGDVAIAVAGGLESMSNAPYLLPKARAGLRMGHAEMLDHMFYDGLQSPFDGQLMGVFAENTAQKYGFSRGDQDAFATESTQRALKAIDSGAFAAEITPVTVKGRKGETVVERDETPFTVDLSKIRHAEARVPQGRHGDRGGIVLDFGRRCRRRAHVGRRGRAPRHQTAGTRTRLRELRPRAGVVHHRPRGRHSEAAGAVGLEGRATLISTRSTKPSRS